MKTLLSLLAKALSFLKGSPELIGTSKNLLREIAVGVLTTVGTYLVMHMLLKAPSPSRELGDVVKLYAKNQRSADSVIYTTQLNASRKTIDSLKLILIQRNEKDSIAANKSLSTYDAAGKLIEYTRPKSRQPRSPQK